MNERVTEIENTGMNPILKAKKDKKVKAFIKKWLNFFSSFFHIFSFSFFRLSSKSLINIKQNLIDFLHAKFYIWTNWRCREYLLLR